MTHSIIFFFNRSMGAYVNLRLNLVTQSVLAKKKKRHVAMISSASTSVNGMFDL